MKVNSHHIRSSVQGASPTFPFQPPPGIACWAAEGGDRLDRLEARIIGPEDTPYMSGVFKLEISVPEQYPIQPPNVRFVTKIYHPNIDGEGRICLDLLKLPPKVILQFSIYLYLVLIGL